MKIFIILFAILLGIQSSYQLTETLGSGEDVCRFFPDGTVMRKPGTCDETIICQDGKTTPGTKCTTAGQGWSLASKKCARVSDSYCGHNCKKNGDTWVSDVKNCKDWVQCNGATKVTEGTCPSGQVFNQKQQMCVYETDICAVTYDVCNVAPQDQPFWDEINCHKYYTCNSRQTTVINECPIGTYYHVRSGKCVAKSQAYCYKHPYPKNVCGTSKLAIRNRFVKDEATCRGYFHCKDLGSGVPDTSPIWGQCPKDMFFDYTQEACRHRTHVVCDEDRCDGRQNGLELSEKSGCQHYLKCENGATTAEEKCPDNLYFNVDKEECISIKTAYPICA